MLYPQKNLIPPFTDSGWFNDGSPTWALRDGNPYSMNLTLSVSANGRLIWIPVEMGKTYTFSFGKCAGLYRLYKRKVATHDTNMVLANHSEAGKPDTYTFTVDSSYQGFITIRLTYGASGTFTFENLQLEEGTKSTAFSPYTLGNARPIKERDLINTDPSGASSHAFPYGNIISVKKDVRLKASLITVASAGSFNVIVQEWKEGSSLVGDPVFKKDTTYNSGGTYVYDFDGVVLEGGKTYYIGRYGDSSGTGFAPVNRKLGMPPTDYKFVSTLGGTSATATSILYGTTYYYFFSLEFERVANVDAILAPNKNLVPPFSAWKLHANATVKSDYSMVLNSSAAWNTSSVLVPLEIGETYTHSAKLSGDARVEMWMNGANQSTLDPVTTTRSFVAISSVVEVRFVNKNQIVGVMTLDDLQLEKGATATPFKPQTQANKRATMSPAKNLLPKQNLVFGSWQGVPSALNTGSSLYYAFPTPIRLKAGTYTISSRGDVNAALVNGSAVYLSSNNNLPQQFTIPYDTDVYIHFRKKDNTAWGSFPTDTQELGIQLEKGATATAYKPYTLANPPADLVPQKNLVPPFSQWNKSAAFTVLEDYKNKAVFVSGVINSCDVTLNLEIGKTYTLNGLVSTPNARIRLGNKRTGALVGVVNQNWTPSLTFTATDIQYLLSIDNNYGSPVYGGEALFENIQLEEGSKVTTFQPLVLGNKKL